MTETTTQSNTQTPNQTITLRAELVANLYNAFRIAADRGAFKIDEYSKISEINSAVRAEWERAMANEAVETE